MRDPKAGTRGRVPDARLLWAVDEFAWSRVLGLMHDPEWDIWAVNRRCRLYFEETWKWSPPLAARHRRLMVPAFAGGA